MWTDVSQIFCKLYTKKKEIKKTPLILIPLLIAFPWALFSSFIGEKILVNTAFCSSNRTKGFFGILIYPIGLKFFFSVS
ncbi:MAG: hypothetical protein CM15mP118_0120 [Alphaproteobacteria bacterium]|nr:MAG: hypothetical protein CM15mP118_0120 [Alphaproteobacteria bacterium]